MTGIYGHWWEVHYAKPNGKKRKLKWCWLELVS